MKAGAVAVSVEKLRTAKFPAAIARDQQYNLSVDDLTISQAAVTTAIRVRDVNKSFWVPVVFISSRDSTLGGSGPHRCVKTKSTTQTRQGASSDRSQKLAKLRIIILGLEQNYLEPTAGPLKARKDRSRDDSVAAQLIPKRQTR